MTASENQTNTINNTMLTSSFKYICKNKNNKRKYIIRNLEEKIISRSDTLRYTYATTHAPLDDIYLFYFTNF